MRVVINMQDDGRFHVVTDAACEVFIVSDQCPSDRVYRLTNAHKVGVDAVDAELGDSQVGHAMDERHAAIENRIIASMTGQRHLKPVSDLEG